MKRLFDENSCWTEDARDVERAMHSTMRGVFVRFVEQGYCPRDIAHVLHGLVAEIESDQMIDVKQKISAPKNRATKE